VNFLGKRKEREGKGNFQIIRFREKHEKGAKPLKPE